MDNFFRVIDTQTGKEPDIEQIALTEKWAKGLIYCDMEGFALLDDSSLIMLDECGNHVFCPVGRFKIILFPGTPIEMTLEMSAVEEIH